VKTDVASLDFGIITKSLQGLTLWQPIAIFGAAYLIGLIFLVYFQRHTAFLRNSSGPCC